MPASLSPVAAIVIAAASLAIAPAQAAPLSHGHRPSRAEIAKRDACEKVWAAQKVRHGPPERFIAACVAKG